MNQIQTLVYYKQFSKLLKAPWTICHIRQPLLKKFMIPIFLLYKEDVCTTLVGFSWLQMVDGKVPSLATHKEQCNWFIGIRSEANMFVGGVTPPPLQHATHECRRPLPQRGFWTFRGGTSRNYVAMMEWDWTEKRFGSRSVWILTVKMFHAFVVGDKFRFD